MTRKEVLLLLAYLEKNFPVWDWKYGDIDIWPIVKKDIFFIFFNMNKIPLSKPKTNTIVDKIQKTFSSFFYFLNINFRKSKHISTFYCGAAPYRVDFESNFINKFFFPLTQGVDKRTYIQYEYDSIIKDKKYENKESIIYVSKLHFIFKLFRKFKKKPSLILYSWNEVRSCVLERSGLDLNSYYKKLPAKLESIMAFADISSLLIKKYCPEKIIGLCYYNNAMFAMHYMANKMGIENSDLQHGGQGSLHSMYTFTNFPKSGSNILPKTFWCWDEASANHIKSWLGSHHYHNIEVNGNPWIEFQLRKYSDRKVLSDKKIILYTLQETKLEEYILKTIKETPDDFCWWIRLHPRMLNAKDKIESQLESIGFKDKVEIVKATNVPLPILLKSSFIHISKFSGSIIEAVQLNIPNIIIDEVGEEIYKDYIINGNAKTVLTNKSEDLLSCILTMKINN